LHPWNRGFIGQAASQYTVSEISGATAEAAASSVPTKKAETNKGNVAAIIVIAIIVCGGAITGITIFRRKRNSAGTDETQNIDINSKRKQ